ncbi:T9SS type A sorting domain-containing protein [bacterium]|nr:T9SS type A sorting domain-containing protein [bacterium]
MKKALIFLFIFTTAFRVFGVNETPGENYRPKTFAEADLARWDFSDADEKVWLKYVVGHQHYRMGTKIIDGAKDCSEGGAGIWKLFEFISANAYDVILIASHGLSTTELVAVYLDTTAACRTVRDSLYTRYNTTFPGCLRKVRFTSKRYGLLVNQQFFRNYFMTPDAFFWGLFCYSSKFSMTGTAEAREYIGYNNAVYVNNGTHDQEYVLNRMDGQQGQDKRPLKIALQGYTTGSPTTPRDAFIVHKGPGNTVLSPSVLENEPQGIVCVRTPGHVKFDCIMDTRMPPDIVIRAEGGGHLEKRKWVGNDKIEYEVVPDVPPPFVIKYIVNSIYAVSRDNWSDLDGNLNPAGSNARGPNWDDFVWYTYCPIIPWVPVVTPPDTFWIDNPDSFTDIPVDILNPTDSVITIKITWTDSLVWMPIETLDLEIPPETDTLIPIKIDWPGWVLDWNHIWFKLWTIDWILLDEGETWATPISPIRIRPFDPPPYLWVDSFFDVFVEVHPAYDGPDIPVEGMPWFENPTWPDAVVIPPGFNPVPDTGRSFRISFPAIGGIDFPAESFFDVFFEILPGFPYHGTHLGKFNTKVGPPIQILDDIPRDYYPIEPEMINLDLISSEPITVVARVNDTQAWTTLLGDTLFGLTPYEPYTINIEVVAGPVGFEAFDDDILGSSRVTVSLEDVEGHDFYVEREFTFNCLNPLVLQPVCDTYDHRAPAGSTVDLEWMLTNRSGIDRVFQVNVFDLMGWPIVFPEDPFTLAPAESSYIVVVVNVPDGPVGLINEVTLYADDVEEWRISRQHTFSLRRSSVVLVDLEGLRYYFSRPGHLLSFSVSLRNELSSPAMVNMEGHGELGTVVDFDPASFMVFSGDPVDVTVNALFDADLPVGIISKLTLIANATDATLSLPAADTMFVGVYMEPDVGIGEKPGIPKSFALMDAVPNPFNSSVMIEFDVPRAEKITIDIFDHLGEKVATLVDGKHSAGSYKAVWNAENSLHETVSSGIYMYQMRAGNFKDTKTMVFIK